MTDSALVAEIVLTIALFLLAAKVHGRQVRLVRELHGFHEVDFMGDNPPWVEGLWRVDRRRYWRTFAMVAPALIALVLVAHRDDLGSGIAWMHFGFAAVLWPMTVAFLANGARDLVRWRRDAREPAPGVRTTAEWVSATAKANKVYWAMVGALTLGLGVVLALA